MVEHIDYYQASKKLESLRDEKDKADKACNLIQETLKMSKGFKLINYVKTGLSALISTSFAISSVSLFSENAIAGGILFAGLSLSWVLMVGYHLTQAKEYKKAELKNEKDLKYVVSLRKETEKDLTLEEEKFQKIQEEYIYGKE